MGFLEPGEFSEVFRGMEYSRGLVSRMAAMHVQYESHHSESCHLLLLHPSLISRIDGLLRDCMRVQEAASCSWWWMIVLEVVR